MHAATAAGMPDAVLKFVRKLSGAARELIFVRLSGVRNIVPVIDQGETGEDWIIAMPRAEKSLRQHLDGARRVLSVGAVTTILSDISDALADLAGQVVHRDVKPENVLLLDGVWCLADFGISRYADAATDQVTRKAALSAPYAAPERWRLERATGAADVYSVGVMAHEMLSGAWPFAGPEMHDFREQHLHMAPPDLPGVPPAMRALVSECMSKAPGARPAPAEVASRLRRASGIPVSGGLAALAQANAGHVGNEAEQARMASVERSATDARAQLVAAARAGLDVISEEMASSFGVAAPGVRLDRGRDAGWQMQMGQATFRFDGFQVTEAAPWGKWDAPAFNVIAHTSVAVVFPPDRYGYEGRSSSLWFCDALEAGRFAWFETAFMIVFSRERARLVPFSLHPGEEAAKALWTGLAEFQIAWPFERLTPGDLDGFIGRWADWFARAAEGRLQYPSTMPERSAQGSWRKA